MDRPLTPATVAAARCAIARALLRGEGTAERARLGGITLHPHQLDAVERVGALLRHDGGALLADAVGLGKTYVALALARDAERPLVVAPAALGDMWRGAMEGTGVRATFVSFETLSRGGLDPARRHDLVVVDEAHHARNPSTRRYHALAALAVGARVLLLSATPVHNRRDDLRALLALFLGARARALDDRAAARLVVRRDRDSLPAHPGPDAPRVPETAAPELLHLPADDALADAILALPPPIAPSDGGDGGALLGHLLVRQWASSDAALRAALRRRLARARALASSLERGVYPSCAELVAWTSDGESQQLAFAELLTPSATAPGPSLDCLRESVAGHVEAVRALLSALAAGGGARDEARADAIAALCARHAGERVVAFSSFAETVDAMFVRLRSRVRVAALTAAGACVAGGPLARRDALARFAPVASGVSAPREAERVELLLTTDLLSEGISLADASVVVHLDLPWTPARLEQRVGRAARLGAAHRRVAVYAVAPPASAEAVLRVERRLREKLRAAGRAVGVAGTILPGLAVVSAGVIEESTVQHGEYVRRALHAWSAAGDGAAAVGRPVGAARAATAGFLALCRPAAPDDAPCVLLAALGDDREASDDPWLVRRAVAAAAAANEDVTPSPEATAEAVAAVERWGARRVTAAAAGIGEAGGARVRRRVIERIAGITRRVPPHRRALLAPLAVGARRAALAPCGAGGEWVLEQLARAELPDEAWLRAVQAFGESAAPRATRGSDAALEVIALLLLRPR